MLDADDFENIGKTNPFETKSVPLCLQKADASMQPQLCCVSLHSLLCVPLVVPPFVAGMAQNPDALVIAALSLLESFPGESLGLPVA